MGTIEDPRLAKLESTPALAGSVVRYLSTGVLNRQDVSLEVLRAVSATMRGEPD